MTDRLHILNKEYRGLDPEARIRKLFRDIPVEDILFTSSFGTSSALLLHMLSRVQPGFPVHFIDTGYLFPETIAYREELEKQLNLNIKEVKPDPARQTFTRSNETYRHNHDLCCYINKVYPVEILKSQYKIWIAGLLQYQSPHRENRQVFEWQDGIVKFHPVVDMRREEVDMYRYLWNLPVHPLVERGYGSVGCIHCTQKGSGRSGRWSSLSKTECGLHA